MKKQTDNKRAARPPLVADARASRASRILYFVITGAFIAGLIYVPLRAAFDESYRENTGYQLMIFQLVMGLVALNLPALLTRKYRWKIPNIFTIIFFVFMLCAVVLGEVAEFYYRIPFWDDILHLTSSMMFGMIGFSMIDILNNDKKHALVNLSPFFVSVFAVSFAVLIGALWEIYEFTFDGLLGLNMQKFATDVAGSDALVNLIGRDALVDTMQDLIIDFSGAVIASGVGYISLKHNTGWLKFFKIEVFSSACDDKADSSAPCNDVKTEDTDTLCDSDADDSATHSDTEENPSNSTCDSEAHSSAPLGKADSCEQDGEKEADTETDTPKDE